MKKLVFVLAVVLLAACGGSASTEVKTDSLVQDSLTSASTDSVVVDSLKK